ncbi:hypothetical protein JIX56_03945 [Streptomyces sp. CA-210063]|uniref:hypothetical protein n=1 Tax=Streptomyces sp. CA-210063 TaxID=2801029 RepID=UPI00214AE745|nr:hypothetical protein [Streptomyces sp. CA-210063]UUU29121.1 hypothetical protein JIX56_03945 [Streptomyces sp. CA-210063]
MPGLTMVAPSEATVGNLQPQIEYVFYGAVAATHAVLPAMREAGVGTLLFTTGGGSVDLVPMLGNVNAAGAALRNWVNNLANELAGSGVHAAHVAINVWIGDGGPEGFPSVPRPPAHRRPLPAGHARHQQLTQDRPAMTFELGVYSFGNTPRRADGSRGPTAQALRDVLEAIKLADEVGLDFW